MTQEKTMDIKAVKFRKDGFYSQPFVFGGEEGQEKFDMNIRYRGSLQNYLIDTGNEVILVDTGLPAGFPDGAPEETASIYIGKSICDYMDAWGHTNGNSLIVAENDGVAFEDLPDDWRCPRCKQPKTKFNKA